MIARWLPPAFQHGIDIDAVDSAVDLPYDIAHLHIEYVRAEPPAVPAGFWRGVGPNNNVFAIECFVDELARLTAKQAIHLRELVGEIFIGGANKAKVCAPSPRITCGAREWTSSLTTVWTA